VTSYRADALAAALGGLLEARGVPAGDAALTAAAMVEGDLRGYPHHGVDRIFQALAGLDEGSLRARPERRVLHEGPAFAVVDGDRGLGPPAAAEAVELAAAKACGAGVGAVGVRGAGHIGILAYYAEMGARRGCLTLVTSTTSPAAVVPGGSERLLGTNPLAYSFPLADGLVTADFSTTAASRGALLHRRDTGQPLEPGWGVDALGRPTTSPAAALEGGLLPHGGDIKGALVSLLLATLAGPLIGGPPNHAVTGTRFMDQPPTKGDLFVCFAIGRFTGLDAFARDSLSQLQAMERSTPGFHVPGSRSHARRRGGRVTVGPALAELLAGVPRLQNAEEVRE
jgi:L-2-hydroxycarboxylate dehydrogenase (NAD+)